MWIIINAHKMWEIVQYPTVSIFKVQNKTVINYNYSWIKQMHSNAKKLNIPNILNIYIYRWNIPKQAQRYKFQVLELKDLLKVGLWAHRFYDAGCIWALEGDADSLEQIISCFGLIVVDLDLLS